MTTLRKSLLLNGVVWEGLVFVGRKPGRDERGWDEKEEWKLDLVEQYVAQGWLSYENERIVRVEQDLT